MAPRRPALFPQQYGLALVTALLLLSNINGALNAIWRVEIERSIATRFLVYWALLTLGPLILATSLTLSSYAFAVVDPTGEGLRWAIPFSGLVSAALLALRDTAKARVKAALLEIGEPATREDIANVCGLPADRISGQLSAIPSVARASKDSWGLVEWVDDVYDGIATRQLQPLPTLSYQQFQHWSVFWIYCFYHHHLQFWLSD